MNYIEQFKIIENEVDIILNNMNSSSFECKKLLYSKALLLYKKYSLINKEFDAVLVNFLKDFKDTKIRVGILIILNIFALLLNNSITIFILITMLCMGYNVYFLRDIYKEKKVIDETIIVNHNTFNNILEKVNKCKELLVDKSNSVKTLDNFDYAIDIIMNYVINNNYNINDISDEIKDLIVKIIKYDLNTDINDINQLLNMYKEQFLLNGDVKKLIMK